MTEQTELAGQPPGGQREYAEVLADAVRVLTEAARMRRTVMQQAAGGWEPHPTKTEQTDWAEFVTLAVAGAVANVGSVEKALAGRPGSWEAGKVRDMVHSTVGEDDEAELLRHRTEPLRVEIWPEETLVDIGYSDLYDESGQILADQMDQHMWHYRYTDAGSWEPLDEGAPAYDGPADDTWSRPGGLMMVARSEQDEDEYTRLGGIEAALDALEANDAQEYGAALRARVLQLAAEKYPDLAVEVEVRSGFPQDRDGLDDDGSPEAYLLEVAIGTTPLPWSQVAPNDYIAQGSGCDPWRALRDIERAAGRLPHQRASETTSGPDDNTTEA